MSTPAGHCCTIPKLADARRSSHVGCFSANHATRYCIGPGSTDVWSGGTILDFDAVLDIVASKYFEERAGPVKGWCGTTRVKQVLRMIAWYSDGSLPYKSFRSRRPKNVQGHRKGCSRQDLVPGTHRSALSTGAATVCCPGGSPALGFWSVGLVRVHAFQFQQSRAAKLEEEDCCHRKNSTGLHTEQAIDRRAT